MTQAQAADFFELKSQGGWSRHENGEIEDINLVKLAELMKKAKINPLYLFEFIDEERLDLADLEKHPIKIDEQSEIAELKKAILDRIPEAERKEPLFPTLKKQRIRDILEDIGQWEDGKLDMVWAFVQGMKTTSIKKERKAVG